MELTIGPLSLIFFSTWPFRNHFFTCRLKIGNNLFKLKESGNVTYIEAFSKIASLIDADEPSSYDVVIEHLLEDIKKEMSENAFVILDKISMFYNLGMPTKTTMKFIREIQKHAVKKGCIIVTCSKSYSKLGMDEQDDFVHEDDEAFLSYLSHGATLNIVVRPLSTGKSMNVTGNMIFLWNLPNQNGLPKYYQFRLEEKDVKVFSAGTSNAVL